MSRTRLIATLCLLLAPCAACVADGDGMMDNMGGGPGQSDAAIDRGLMPDGAPAPDYDPPDGPPLALDDVQARGSWKSYHLPEEQPFLDLDFEHPPLDVQLDEFGWRHFDFDLDYNPSGGGVYAVYNHRIADFQSRCRGNLADCLAPMAAWSAEHPRHAPIVVLFQQTSSMMPDIYGTLDRLEYYLDREMTRGRIFTPGDALADHPGLTLRQMLSQHGWPALDRARGKFIFVLFDEPSREPNRNWPGWGNVEALQGLLWVYADGDSEEELAADDAAFAMLDEITSDAQQARARELVERGYIVRAPAHTADSYARAAAAGVHLISSKYPGDLFPGPADGAGWPVGCNPVSAPAGCDPRQIEIHRPPGE